MAAPAGRDGVGKAKPPSSSRTARVAPVLALALEIRTAVSNHEVRDLIRRMNAANPPWGLPRIHGELLKIGIEISQRQLPSTWCENEGRWRSFLRNQVAGIAAIDMFVVASASFQLLYVMIILAHDHRKIVRFHVTRYPTSGWLARQVTEAFP
jgi:hypothetical protein